MNIPTIWLWISGAFFVMNTIYLAVLTAILLRIYRQMGETKPQLDRLVERADAISVRVESVATQVDDIAKTVNGTVKSVSGRANAMVGSAEAVASSVTTQLGRFAPILSAVMAGLKLYGAYQAARPPKKTPSKALDRKSRP